MVPRFANPHLLPQDVETTTRAKIAGQSELTSVARDSDTERHSLKRNLDNLLRDTWADALADICSPSRDRERREIAEHRKEKDGQLVEFRLVSSMKQPQQISLDPKPPPPTASRAPDCEDSKMQAEMRRTRALSVAVDSENLRDAAASLRQVVRKAVITETKTSLADTPSARLLPRLLVTEEICTCKSDQRVDRQSQIDTRCTASPHEPRPSCFVLPVMSVPDHKTIPRKKSRKPAKARPSPAYWRPSSNMRGKCVGYGLGYPCSWAPVRAYVRDTMKKGVESTATYP